mmetsp:Transcript_4743/g.7154  ORF Transcript_4743/g.7154 Transcript_4743/m.7154 type:complete len:188 (-) Transcript_4743:1220-1783(-)
MGKTRLINECRYYIKLYNVPNSGVHYLDFKNVSTLDGIANLFSENQIDNLFRSSDAEVHNSEKTKTVLIYDNLELIEEKNLVSLEFHLKNQVLKDDAPVIVILLHQTKISSALRHRHECKEIILEPLSPRHSAHLVLEYSLRSKQGLLSKGKVQHLTAEELDESEAFENCSGLPAALMTLALTLRNF